MFIIVIVIKDMKHGAIACIAMVICTLFTTHTDVHHEFCESELWSHRIEILNILTSLCMIYFPVRSILQNDKNRNYLPEDILIAVGVGSALFHYHNSFITALFDELGMLLFTLTLSNLAFQNKFIRISSAIICAIVMILKLCGMSSKQFSVAFAIYAVYVGVLGVLNKIISYKLALKLIGIAVIRQITEDYCLDMPIIISLLGHPAWHIFIAKFAVELADHIYSYVLFSKLIIKID